MQICKCQFITDGVAGSANEGGSSSSKRTMDLEYQNTFSESKKLRLNDDFEISREDLEAAGSSKGSHVLLFVNYQIPENTRTNQ